MQGRRPFYISLVDIVLKRFRAKKKERVFFPSHPPRFFNIRYVSPQYNISECTSQVGQLLLETSKRTGLSLSLSISLYLSRSGWFHDEVAKQLIKVRTTGSNSGSNEYGTTKVLAHVPIFDSLPPWMSAGKGPAKLVPGRAGPCLLTALPHKVLVSTSGSYYAIEPCTIHNFTLAHGS